MNLFADLPTLPVFVIAMQRSGTNLLRKSLAQTPLFTDLNEVFDPFHAGFWAFRKKVIQLDPEYVMPSEPHQTRLWTNFLRYRLANVKTPFALIDVKYNSTHNLNAVWQEPGDPPLLVRWLQRQSLPIIHIVRENLLDGYVSNLLACQLKIWVSDDDRVSQGITFTLDPRNTVTELSRRRREIDLFRDWLFETQHIELTYESLTASEDNDVPRNTIRQVGRLLKIDPHCLPHSIPIATRKMGRSAAQLVTNYTEIVQALYQNGVEPLISTKKAA